MARVNNLLASLPPHSLCVVPAYGLRYASACIFYPFQVHKDFFYLSALREKNCVLLLTSVPSVPWRSSLFVHSPTKHNTLWDGHRMDSTELLSVSNLDCVKDIQELQPFLADILRVYSSPSVSDPLTVYFDPVAHPSDLDNISDLLQRHYFINFHNAHSVESEYERFEKLKHRSTYSRRANSRWPNSTFSSLFSPSSSPNSSRINVRSFKPLIDNLRLYKSDSELELLSHCGKISGKMFQDAMRFSSLPLRTQKQSTPSPQSPDLIQNFHTLSSASTITEHQLSSVFTFSATMNGASGLAYVPVIASGKNGLSLHYTSNSDTINNDAMILCDVGAQYNEYVSDITRTWPIRGKFTKPEREIYSVVLKAQVEMIKLCRETANLSLNELMKKSQEVMRVGLEAVFGRQIGWEEMNELYPHHIGHYMGLDVHDTETISRNLKLKKGMVITIEPGIYIPLESKEYYYPPEYRGIAIRIEDDIYIDKNNPVILTSEAPKEINDIEDILNGVF
ncbi:hypothetical protein HK098_006232 [Nowakowskiella sp. JEL0407]|nr:hypothetical protein HK098_006232 [Nowakowskiella sp. JEL0407]